MAATDPALRRFWLLNALRLAGLIAVLIAIAGLGDRIAMPQALAAALLVSGVGLFFVAPMMIARRWKKRP